MCRKAAKETYQSHDQQPAVNAGKKDEEDRKRLEDDDATCFLMTCYLRQTYLCVI